MAAAGAGPMAAAASTEVLFPPAANWYLAHVVDALPDGQLVLATNQAFTTVDATTRRVTGIHAQRGRVTGVGLAAGGIICTCLADRSVLAVDARSGAQLGSHKEHQAEPSALLVAMPLCITGDKRGGICLWPLPGMAAPSGSDAALATGAGSRGAGPDRLCPQREPLLCLAASGGGVAGGRLAASYVSGAVVVVDLASRAVFCSFRHRAAVQSLSWAPAEGSCCLATSCQDQSVQIWRFSDDGHQADVCEQVAEPLAGGRSQQQQEGRAWVSVLALSESAVVYSGARGELLLWDAAVKRRAARAAPVHTRPIFAIRPVGSDHIVTAGMDRQVVLWTVEKKGTLQMRWRLCCVGGHVTAVRTDGANLACFGSGDGSARVLDLMHREHRQHCWVAWRGLMSPMTSIAPGPAGSNAWAYGLQDGSFGLMPINANDGPGSVVPLSTTSHRGPVTAVCWMGGSAAPQGAAADQDSRPSADAEAAERQEEAPPQKERAPRGKKAAAAAAEKKKDAAAVKELGALPKGACLVTVSTGGQVLLTTISLPDGSASSSRAPVSSVVELQQLPSLSPPVPSSAAVWSSSPGAAGDILVLAALHPARDGLEANSLQLFVRAAAEASEADSGAAVAAEAAPVAAPAPAAGAPATMPVGSALRCVAALCADGLDGGVSSMALCGGGGTSAELPRDCWALCGTVKGNLAVLRLSWPSPAPGPLEAPGQTWPRDAFVRLAHSRDIVDVQWHPTSSAGLQGRFLTASLDGCLKVWGLEGSPLQIQMLHVLSGPFQQRSAGGVPLLAACWDTSGGQDEMAVLAGGREQVAFRWRPGAPAATTQGAEALAALSGVDATAAAGAGAAYSGVLHQPQHHAAARAASGPQSLGAARAAKQRTKAASLLSLASAAIFQQSSKARATDLVRLFPASQELWPGDSLVEDTQPPAGAGSGASPPSLAAAVFTNHQHYADWWVQAEVFHKMDAKAEERATAIQKARLLKLWATDVREALVADLGEDPGLGASGADVALPAAWLWAALSPAADRSAWEAALGQLLGSPLAEGAHHSVAAALALERVDEAVRLYVRAEFFPDALLLARLRLPAKHPMVAYVYEQWAAHLKTKGRHDQAAACHAAAGCWGAAAADLEDWLAPASAQAGLPSTASPGLQLGPDPVRLAGTFAAAVVAETIITAQLSKKDSAFAALEVDEGGAFDATLAYDHRHWWGCRELRAATEAWKRCLVEALHARRGAEAAAMARVEVRRRPLSQGEHFLRATLAGYASALNWWQRLQADGSEEVEEEEQHRLQQQQEHEAPARGGGSSERSGKRRREAEAAADEAEEDEEASCMLHAACEAAREASPLQRFFTGGQDEVCPDEDWDFEWRSLTWLPGFAATGDDPMLAGAVWLGRACAELGSGASGDGDAPWDHVASGVDSLLAAGGSATELTARSACRLAGLARRHGGSAAAGVFGRCLATCAKAAAIGEQRLRLGPDPWPALSALLFGVSVAVAPMELPHPAMQMLHRGSLMLDAISSSSMCRAAISQARCTIEASGAARGHTMEGLCQDLEAHLLEAANSCGLAAAIAAPSGAGSSTAASDASSEASPFLPACCRSALQQARRLHEATASARLVPLAASLWCQRLAQRWAQSAAASTSSAVPRSADDEDADRGANDEYQEVAAADSSSPWLSALEAAALVRGLEELAGAHEGSPEAQEDEAMVQGALRLEKHQHLNFRQRLVLARRCLQAAGEETASSAASSICELLLQAATNQSSTTTAAGSGVG